MKLCCVVVAQEQLGGQEMFSSRLDRRIMFIIAALTGTLALLVEKVLSLDRYYFRFGVCAGEKVIGSRHS